ncbi:DUF881 domain-containing protein [Brevibacillus massiliensis]|jgi:uncharacterized protein YlxW (UPF0749 family)|uniref:DUF881 domain-containing protein n=1 Tax=Brevibacillus massiliensis TaxID=1118054 RepID=UPI0002F5B59A|nr:DUF881 domain-containing protein [Brevibacillus massiliensis]
MLGQNRKITFILTAISVIIGVMLATQLQSTLKPEKVESRSLNELRISLQKEIEKHQNLLNDISKFEHLLYQYDTSLNERESISVMKEELARARKLAGLESAEGPGVVVRIEDMKLPPGPLGTDDGSPAGTEALPDLLIDEDLRWLVNELLVNGAKAVAINGQRLVATSAIRNVGQYIQVNTYTIRPPYEIAALGDPEVLVSGLKLSGIEETFQLANKTVVLEKRDTLTLPPFTGNQTIHYMKPVKAKGDS